jgi:hypothetical protein
VRGFLRHVSLLIGVLVIIVSMFLARSTLREYGRRKGLYWYDVERSYEYRFDSKAVTRIPVAIDDSGFEWPTGAAPCETALLRVSLSARRSGHWFEPEVRISTSGLDPFTQHFERRGLGTRYLNVSPICRTSTVAGDRVSISASHAMVDSGSGELLLFRDPVLSGKRLLVLAPHPDDAEIAAFALYRSSVSTIVTATVGDYANRTYTHLVDDPSEVTPLLGRLRAWDSISVPIWGGVSPEHSVLLGYLGGTLESMYAEPDSEVGAERGGTEELFVAAATRCGIELGEPDRRPRVRNRKSRARVHRLASSGVGWIARSSTHNPRAPAGSRQCRGPGRAASLVQQPSPLL